MSRLTLSALVGLAACLSPAAGDTPERAGPRHKMVVTCYNGKIGSGSFCSADAFQRDGSLAKTGKMTCGYQGRVSEIEWSFVEPRAGKDVYRFTRRFPVAKPNTATASKEVAFDGKRLVVFEDDYQCIVVEGPKKR